MFIDLDKMTFSVVKWNQRKGANMVNKFLQQVVTGNAGYGPRFLNLLRNLRVTHTVSTLGAVLHPVAVLRFFIATGGAKRTAPVPFFAPFHSRPTILEASSSRGDGRSPYSFSRMLLPYTPT